MISLEDRSQNGGTVVQYFNKAVDARKITIEWFVEHNMTCSVCRKAINSFDDNAFELHPQLQVVICLECYSQYRENDEACCTWCQQKIAPTLKCCVTQCSGSVCESCLKFNFTKDQVRNQKENSDSWKCFSCYPERIEPHRFYGRLAKTFSLHYRAPICSITPSMPRSCSLVNLDFANSTNELIKLMNSNDKVAFCKALEVQLKYGQALLNKLNSDDHQVNMSTDALILEDSNTAESLNGDQLEAELQLENGHSLGAIKVEPSSGSLVSRETPGSANATAVKDEPCEQPQIDFKQEILDEVIVEPEEGNSEIVMESNDSDSDIDRLLSDIRRRTIKPTENAPTALPKPKVSTTSVKQEADLSETESTPDNAHTLETFNQSNGGFFDMGPIIVLSSDDELLSYLGENDEEEEEEEAHAEEILNKKTAGKDFKTKPSSDEEEEKSHEERIKRRPIPALPSDSLVTQTRKRKMKKSKASSKRDTTTRTVSDSSSEFSSGDLSVVDLSPPKKIVKSEMDKKNGSSTARRLSLISDSENESSKQSTSPKKFIKQANKSITTSEDPCVISSDDESDFVSSSKTVPTVDRVKAEQIDLPSTSSAGRRNIRDMLSGDQLSKATVQANSEEKERRRRIEEMQKKYNQFERQIQSNASESSGRCILEFDLVSKMPLVEIHPELAINMKSHQVDGVKFLYQNLVETVQKVKTNSPGTGAILGHCMGLGKTYQVICLLHTLMTHPQLKEHFHMILIISPLNVIKTWESEVNFWVQRNAKIKDKIFCDNMQKEATQGLRITLLRRWKRRGGIVLMTPKLLTSILGSETEAGQKKRSKYALDKTLLEEYKSLLCSPGPDMVIVDEGHTLKRNSTQSTQVVQMIKTRRKVLLTGTPLQNNLTEYFTMVSIVSPHLLGTKLEFKNRFENPITNGQYKNSTTGDIRKMRHRASVLNKLLETIVHRRDLSVLQSILPPRHDYVLSIRLSALQETLYEKFLSLLIQKAREMSSKSSAPTFKKLLQDYVLLRSVWTHPRLLTMPKKTMNKKQVFATVSDMLTFDSITNEAHQDSLRDWFKPFLRSEDLNNINLGPKLCILFDIIAHCGLIGDKLVVFCTQLSALDLIEFLLRIMHDNKVGEGSWVKQEDFFRMDGSTSSEDRHKFFNMFNSPTNIRARLFLVSTNAGKLGSTLTGANRMVLLDTSWNPADDNQAVYRIYRIGQQKPVFIYRFVSYGTMEEKIYARNILKESTSCRVLDDSNMERHFTHEDINDLYKFTPFVRQDRVRPNLPKDRLLADLIMRHEDIIVKVHEHQQLLQNLEDNLTEDERRVAWDEYQKEKDAPTGVQGASAAPNPHNHLISNDPVTTQIYERVLSLDRMFDLPTTTDQHRVAMYAQERHIATICLSQFAKKREQLKMILTEALKRHGSRFEDQALLIARIQTLRNDETVLTNILSKWNCFIRRISETQIRR